MLKKEMRRTITILILLSVVIYGLQLLIFKDPRNTFYYIFQDFAFLPITIALATLVVGEIMDKKEREERVQKTKMLTSTFYTELGTKLTAELIKISTPKEEIKELLLKGFDSNISEQEFRKRIKALDLKINLNEEVYTEIIHDLIGSQTSLLILSSNPLLLEHEDFTDLLWALFHLMDEYHVRGEFAQMTEADIAHLNDDYRETMKLLLINYFISTRYLKTAYPNLYNTAKKKFETQIK